MSKCQLVQSEWRNMAHLLKDYYRLQAAAQRVVQLPLNQGQTKDFYDAIEALRVLLALGASP